MSKEVDDYLNKQNPQNKEICLKLRQIIFKTIPGIKEEMKWGVPTYADGIYYLVALKDHVNLGFSLKWLSKEEQRLLEGSGKTMKHIEISSLREIDERRIVDLLKSIWRKQDGKTT
jgi:hypothetical protein